MPADREQQVRNALTEMREAASVAYYTLRQHGRTPTEASQIVHIDLGAELIQTEQDFMREARDAS